MSRGTKTTFLTLATIFTAGCASSDFVLQHQRQKTWQPVEDDRIYKATEEVPPKILPETFFAAGSLLEAQGLAGSAIEQYQKAIAVNHEYVAAYHRLGLLLSTVGRHQEATKALRRAVALLPTNATLRNNLGYSFMRQQFWADAEREFSRARELRPGFPRACINHGMALSRLGRFDAALASFEAVLPQADASYNLGLMYRGQHRFERAVETFRNILSIDPGFTAATAQLEQLSSHFPPDLPSEAVALAAKPVTPEGDTVLTPDVAEDRKTFSADSGSDSRAEIDDTTALRDMVAEEPGVDRDRPEAMPEGIVARGELREHVPSPEEIEDQLQIVRNEIDCLDGRDTQQRDEFTVAFADLACWPETFALADATLASEADFVAAAGEDELFGPWLSTPASQLTLGQLLGILPAPTATPKKTMGMSIVSPDHYPVDASPADEPEIASHNFLEEEPDPCEEEEPAQDAADERWGRFPNRSPLDVPNPARTVPAADRASVQESGPAPQDTNKAGDTAGVSKSKEVPGDSFYPAEPENAGDAEEAEADREEEIGSNDDANVDANAPEPNRDRVAFARRGGRSKEATPSHRVESARPQPVAELTAMLSIIDNDLRCMDELEAEFGPACEAEIAIASDADFAAVSHRDRVASAPLQPVAELTAMLSIIDNDSRCLDELEAEFEYVCEAEIAIASEADFTAVSHGDRVASARPRPFARLTAGLSIIENENRRWDGFEAELAAAPYRSRKRAAPTYRAEPARPQPTTELTAMLSIIANETRCLDELEAEFEAVCEAEIEIASEADFAAVSHRDRVASARPRSVARPTAGLSIIENENRSRDGFEAELADFARRNPKGATHTYRAESTRPQPFAELAAMLSIIDNQTRCLDEGDALAIAASRNEREGEASDGNFADCLGDDVETFSSFGPFDRDATLLPSPLILPNRPL